MGEWDNTAFVATADAAAVADALAKLFESSGRTLVEGPRLRRPPFPDPMQYGTGETSSRWAAAVLAGKKWTVIKTAPFELLCESGDGRPRLAMLAEALGCDAFQLNLYDGDSHILLEANAKGAFRISGFNASTGPGPFHGYPIEDGPTRFGLLRVGKPLTSALELGVSEGSRRMRELLHGEPELCDNAVQVEYLIPHEPLANAIVLHADRPHARPLREPMEVALAVERSEEEARYRLQLPAGELWLETGAGTVLAPRASADSAALVASLATWLDVPADVQAERVPSAVAVFGDLVEGELSIGEALPIGVEIDEARGHATLREIDPNIAADIVATLARAWTGKPSTDVIVPHVERVPIGPHRGAEVVAAADCFVIATSHELRTCLWTWRPGEDATRIADVAGRLEQLARGPKRHQVTLRVGHGVYGHGPDDERDIAIFDVDGERRPIIERMARADTFAWSSDGKRLCVQINGGKGRSHLQLFDNTGVALARSPDTLPLASPRWFGPLVYCRRPGNQDATWRPSDNAVDVCHDWLDRSPSGVMMRGDAFVTWIGEHRLEGVVRVGAWTDPLAWLDDDTCVLARGLDEEGAEYVAVDVRDVRVSALVASKRARPCAQIGDVIVANDGWRLWWGRVVAR